MKAAKRTLQHRPALPKLPSGSMKAIWLWDLDTAFSHYEQTVDIILKGGFNEVYTSHIPAYADTMRTFISRLGAAGIKVHALYGSADWAYTVNQANGIAAIDEVKAYNAASAAAERYAGFQMDVEPHTLGQTWTDNRGQICVEWVGNMQAFGDAIRAGGMVFSGAFPFWLDTVPTGSAADQIPADIYPLHEEFMQIVDAYCIMSYRDAAADIMAAAAEELATTFGKKLMLGMELTKQDPEEITFFEEGYDAFTQAMVDVDGQATTKPAYRGIAVHDFNQYRQITYKLQGDKYSPRTMAVKGPLRAAK